MVMHYQASHTAEVICFAGLVFGPVIRSKVHSRVNTGASLSGSHHQTTLFLFFFPKISSQRVVLEEVLGLLTQQYHPGGVRAGCRCSLSVWHVWILRSSTCAGRFQALLPGCASSCSLETLLLQVFVLIKARDMNMQDSKHHGLLSRACN